ncbi:hypothetical protein ACHWQZ_G013239 [Mnemiopsis leidyi]
MDPLAISNNLKHLSQHSVSALSSVTETSEFTVKERFTSIETQLNNVRKMVIDGGMGPVSCTSDQIKFQVEELKLQNSRLETNSLAAFNRMKEASRP